MMVGNGPSGGAFKLSLNVYLMNNFFVCNNTSVNLNNDIIIIDSLIEPGRYGTL